MDKEQIEGYIEKKLFELQDIKYRDFHKRLIPTVDEKSIIGVRTPALRKFAKEFAKNEPAVSKDFLKILPHRYYDENNLHAFLIEQEKNFSDAMTLCESFLPYIDNWATCDTFSPKCFKKHPSEVYAKVKEWIKSDKIYTVRYAVVTLLQNFLDDNFEDEMLSLAASASCDEYYINMAVAWYFSIALIKQYDKALPYIEKKKLPVWVHNKAIQKAVESYRIDGETKAYLKTLK